MYPKNVIRAAAVIQKKIKSFRPNIGLILGSGLDEIAEKISTPIEISYTKIPGFVKSKVKGHKGKIVFGKLQNRNVACLRGRTHLYEGVKATDIAHYIYTLKLLGCEILIITNAAGSLNPEIPIGGIMCISDHINFQFTSPLIGRSSSESFVAMNNVYDPNLRKTFFAIAEKNDTAVYEGVYIGVVGPSFETPAEIRAFRSLGADAVGMSTVQEAIAARYCGMKVLGISAISNLAEGLSKEKLSHEQTLKNAQSAAHDLGKLLINFIAEY